MPRPPRPDLSPEIVLPDDADAKRRASDAAGREWRVRVSPVDDPAASDDFAIVYGEIHQRLDDCRRRGVHIDVGLLMHMASQIEMASARKVLRDGSPVRREGGVVHKLVKIGCRLRRSQEELAESYGCSRQHVNEQLAILRNEGFIGNWGNGWIEFDASLVWRGDYQVHNAYIEVQPLHPSLRMKILGRRRTEPEREDEESQETCT